MEMFVYLLSLWRNLIERSMKGFLYTGIKIYKEPVYIFIFAPCIS